MRQHQRGGAALVVMIALVGIVLAAANLGVLVMALRASNAATAPATTILSAVQVSVLAYFIGAPLIGAALLIGLALTSTRAPAVAAAAPKSPPQPSPPSPALALRLLGLLQQEGRLVDFVQEDIDAYSDEQVGAAVRSIHAGCRKVLREHVQLQRIFAKEDGSELVVEQGFDPAAVRLTGNVTGAPPFRGTLQHGGWRASNVSLPESAADPSIIAPAEVEIA